MYQLNRRHLLASAFGAAAMSAASRTANAQEPAIPGKSPMILHNDPPEDLEMPNAYFDQWLTPNDKFFVRQHLPRPEVKADSFRLTVNGLVSKPLELKIDDLRKLPQHKVVATLECTGNGRGFYRPRVPGIQWGRGAIGNAQWSGPRVSEILKLAGAKTDAAFLESDGADVGLAKTPDFIRSLPMKKALDPATLLAIDMNGEPVPQFTAFPRASSYPAGMGRVGSSG